MSLQNITKIWMKEEVCETVWMRDFYQHGSAHYSPSANATEQPLTHKQHVLRWLPVTDSSAGALQTAAFPCFPFGLGFEGFFFYDTETTRAFSPPGDKVCR